ncbi:hypothetical protein SODALDRAFT_333086 [Sodiomyces alkalinus F11]|uniref:Sas10 C-terminal domain-containing protein n=1 Tax=Sodiomyces alkalinus (strain CBS 110278 / VKM F-3762 / F11) TaxID=1314773 RepID=A0A3N2PVG0_SODAK|nr:hypothetical protein SODALDRAFT_333086 [Sodiomyces alkalinus F11]ROT38491.1 hypothetical protein SODALDRAFT_333086 [Sodiomyces alkalinus F11]
MGKKRKASGRNEKPSGPKEVDPADALLGPISTYEDVANSEDEYFINRDKIMFDEAPQSKRRRRQDEEDKFLELSEEEILADDDEDESEEEEEEEEDADIPSRKAAPAAAGRKRGAADSDDEDETKQGQDVEDSGWWGDSKTEYYDADQIETEADALEEEAEAKRLQQKKLSKMTEEDFLFDQTAWLESKPDGEGEGEGGDDVVTEVLRDVEITDDMTPDYHAKLLRTRYPEFEYLVAEFQELQPKLAILQKEALGKPGKSIEAVRYWVLGCYVAALASYFAILTSPSRDDSTTTTRKTLHPSELRDHAVMETLVSCRNAWQRLGRVQTVCKDELPSMDMEPAEANGLNTARHTKEERHRLQQERKQRKAKDKVQKAKDKRAEEIEESLADLDNLVRSQQKRSKAAADFNGNGNGNANATTEEGDDHSDFGEEDYLDARTAQDKAARKKSLRFYTSQIVQKANRRADAGRDAGGDTDIPYRERLRDRQARLNAEAERRGKKFGADLGGDDGDSNDDDEENDTAAVRRGGDEDDEYYDMVAGKSKQKKEDKAARRAALAAASAADRVVEREVVGEDGKRRITYAIEKNKGLAPRRKKENRNPRVKKKMQYDAKQKKLRSMKATFKGGEPRGGYGGELSGISTHVVRSRKL